MDTKTKLKNDFNVLDKSFLYVGLSAKQKRKIRKFLIENPNMELSFAVMLVTQSYNDYIEN